MMRIKRNFLTKRFRRMISNPPFIKQRRSVQIFFYKLKNRWTPILLKKKSFSYFLLFLFW